MFHQPMEYDPSLLDKLNSGPQTREQELKHELGLDDSESEDESDNIVKGLTEELERKKKQIIALSEQLSHSQHIALEAESHIKQLQQTVKSTKTFLVKEYEGKIKSLEDQVAAQRIQIKEDDEIMEALHQRIDELDRDRLPGPRSTSTESSASIVNKLRESEKNLNQSKMVIQKTQEEVTQLKSKNQELQSANEAQNMELGKLKEALEKAKSSAAERSNATVTNKEAPVANVPSPSLNEQDRKRLEQLENERKTFKAELRRRETESSQLLNTIDELSRKLKDQEEKHLKQQLQATVQNLEESQEQTMASVSMIENLKADLSTSQTALSASEQKNESLQEMLKEMNGIVQTKDHELKVLKEKARNKLGLASAQIKKLKEEYGKIRTAYMDLVEKVNEEETGRNQELEQENVALASRVQGLTKTNQKTLEGLRHIGKEFQHLKKSCFGIGKEVKHASHSFFQDFQGIAKELCSAVQMSEDKCLSLSKQYEREYRERRKYFNIVQELKGNVRVYCRVRPQSDQERKSESGKNVSQCSEGRIEILNREKNLMNRFEFEHVFGPEVDQEGVFKEVEPLIVSVLDGYNVCIFAYGQTGSGKTYTMDGPRDQPGVNHRALRTLFEKIQNAPPQTVYNVNVSLLEIYNEKMVDLLSESRDDTGLKIVRGEFGTEVQNLIVQKVSSYEDVASMMKRGSMNRSVGRTDMNERSSRSHLVLSIYVDCFNQTTDKRFVSKMHLVDLAGSERVSRSNASGVRLKEAQSINSSLSALGLCISSRVNKQSHVPYRNSVLTYLLQDSLEKNSKTLMIVQASPCAIDAAETINSLRFAEHVRKVELGPVKKNLVPPKKSPRSPKY